HHGRAPPGAAAGVAVARTVVVAAQRQHRVDGRDEPVGALTVSLVHHEDVGDLHHARLERLYVVARPGDEDHERHVGGADDIDFGLPDADGLDDHRVVAGCREDARGVGRTTGEAAKVTARRHAAHED